MAIITCSCGCNSSDVDHKFVVCCVCKKNYKHSCVELSTTEVRTIRTKKGLSWSCAECASLGNSINELKAAILDLRRDIQARNTDGLNDTEVENLLQELTDRFERRQNIVIFKLDEIESQNKRERNEHDLSSARMILGNISTDVDTDRIEVHRVGRYVKDRPRPLKIKLGSVKDVHLIIKKVRKLRDIEEFKHISISYDKTIRQVTYYKKVKADLDARVAAGEVNLRIRYRNGMPVISPLN